MTRSATSSLEVARQHRRRRSRLRRGRRRPRGHLRHAACPARATSRPTARSPGVDAGRPCSTSAPARRSPFLTRRALCDLFDLEPAEVRVFCERVGGGFGGKQEMLTEDIVALAALQDRPAGAARVDTRKSSSSRTTTRHPMRVARSRPARGSDGTLTALQMRIVSNTGAYGNHAGAGAVPRLRRVDRRLSLPEQEDRRLRGLHQHRAGRRVSRLRQSADGLRRRVGHRRAGARLGMDPIEFRRATSFGRASRWCPPSARAGRRRLSAATASTSASTRA